MNLIPFLTAQWEPLGAVLFSLYGVEVTTGGLLILAVAVLGGLLLRRPTRRLVRRVAAERLEDEQLQNLAVETIQVLVLVVCVGLGLELGHLVMFVQFIDALLRLINGELFAIGATPVSLTTMMTVVVIFFISSQVSRAVQGAIRRAMSLRLGASEQGTIRVFERLTHYLVLSLGLGVGLQTAGVDLSALFAAGAVFAVGIGFAMQNIAQNFVSGLIVMVERVIRPGDVLEVEGQVVRVETMGIRSTVVRTLSDEHLIVPNSTLAQNTIKNYTLKKPALRIRAMVGVAYESDLRKVSSALLRASQGIEGQLPDREPVLLLRDFGSSSVDFELSIWIADPWQRDRCTSLLREAIWWALKDDGVVIAFPQLDVHFDVLPASAESA